MPAPFPTDSAHGTLLVRKPRGKKLQFAIGGPKLDNAIEMIIGDDEPKVWVWVSMDTGRRIEFTKNAKAEITLVSDSAA